MFSRVSRAVGVAAARTAVVPRVVPQTAAWTRGFAASNIDGNAIAQKVIDDVTAGVAELADKFGRKPGLATVLVGARPDSQRYVAMKNKRAAECGFKSFHMELDADVSEDELMSVVKGLNDDEEVDGILVQLPLPEHINQKRVLLAIDVEKDVDGFHPTNMGILARQGEELRQKREGFDTAKSRNASCTPLGCIELLDQSGIEMSGKHAVVLGRSNIVGLPVALMLLHRSCTVSILHSRTQNIAELCSQADIVIAALGQPEMVRGDWIKEGAVVIDVGINFVDDATRKTGRRLCGDVKYDEAAEKASLITPVPGGVGPMTVAMLMRNTFANWRRLVNKS